MKRTLTECLLDRPWHKRCEIIPDYMPPFPSPGTKPTVQVRYDHSLMLRYSRGPIQGYFWDIYGDDMLTVEIAIVALSRAPSPIH